MPTKMTSRIAQAEWFFPWPGEGSPMQYRAPSWAACKERRRRHPIAVFTSQDKGSREFLSISRHRSRSKGWVSFAFNVRIPMGFGVDS
jgi:hypothetical protein